MNHNSKFIVANFKMNGSTAFLEDYFTRFQGSVKHQIILCPPFPYLSQVHHKILASGLQSELPSIYLGGQDCSAETSGARTGEVSATMLADLGCRYVILGHSERRLYHRETSPLIKQKAQEAIRCGLIPILCVGETIEQRDQGNAHKAVLTQLKEIVPVGEILIAYEPLWSIGTGQTPTVEDIALMYQAIHDDEQFAQAPILYGGSVIPDNIAHILSIPGGRGALVGGACLDVTKMNQIANVV